MGRAATLVVFVAWLGASGQARAQDALAGVVDGAESEELRAMRLFEVEIFGGQWLAQLPTPEVRVRISDGPAAVTTDTPAAPSPPPARASRDLSWMRGLTLPDIPVRWDERVIRYIEFFRDDPRGRRHIAAWLRRLDRYGPTIRETLRRQGLPRDLIFVAMVESGFDPTARSHAGAAGLWQFVRSTGEELGLTVNHWLDRRLDPEASTVAAGRYLSMLHRRFGTWELAFAAYNMGYGALLRSIRKYNTNDYWELSRLESGLPYETNLYVSKIIACAIIARNRERFGFGDLEMEPATRWDTVEVPGGVSLSVIARAAGTDTATVRALNPAFRRHRTPPGRGPYRVHIPSGTADRFAERWARVRPGRPVHRPHTMRFGETLGDLARERGVSEASLRELNELGDRAVGAGMVLLVPVTRGRRRAEERREPPVIAVSPGPTEVPGRRRVFYRVTRGDGLRAIASFFRVPIDDVRRWNGIDPNARLQSGMYLQLFVDPELDLSRAVVLTPDEVRVFVVGSEEFFAYHEGQRGRVRFRYRVRAGDTLSAIGQRFGIRSASLARINQIGRAATIHPGDELIVYADPSRVPRELRPDAAAEASDAVAPASEPAAPEPASEPAPEPPSEPAPEPAREPEPTADEVPAPDDPAEVHSDS